MLNSSPNAHGNSLKDSNIQGFLRRAGKNGKSFALRRKRWYKLDGAIFSKHSSETSEATWYVNIQGSDVVQLGRTHFALVLKIPEDRNAVSDFDQDSLILYAKTEEDCKLWVSSLRYASHRKLENHYKIGQLIGEGGFATVRLGKCVLSGELRAIKTMRKSDDHAKLFGTEIAIIKRVNHPNIVKTFDVYETSSNIHIVMEYMEGGMLYDAIEDGVRFSEEDTAQFMRELIDGILYLHRHGIVHRDIKPENVLCTSKSTPLHVKIADFGLSSISNLAGIKENQILMSTMIGTPEFIAPEIANRQEYTEKVDMWALGMLCYNVICGQLPLDDSRDMIPQIRDGISLTFPEPEWESYSEYARSFVKALLCTEPQKRLTPLACLVHPWLEEFKPDESNKFGAHGRVSTFLLQQDSYPVFRSQGRGAPSSSSVPVAKRFGTREDVKRWWKIAVLGVCAANRFDWLINSGRYDGAMAVRLSEETSAASEKMGSETNASEKMSSTRKSGISMESSFNDLDFATLGSDTEDEPSSLQWSKVQPEMLQPEMLHSEKQQAVEGERKSFQEGKLSRKPNSWGRLMEHAVRRKSSAESMAPGSMKKPTLRKKLMNALTQETLVRKLSKKFARIGEEKKPESFGPSPLEQHQVDMDFGDLDLLAVEESEIDDEMSGPASLFGKRHRALMKQSEHSAKLLSPLTPQAARGIASPLAKNKMKGNPYIN